MLTKFERLDCPVIFALNLSKCYTDEDDANNRRRKIWNPRRRDDFYIEYGNGYCHNNPKDYEMYWRFCRDYVGRCDKVLEKTSKYIVERIRPDKIMLAGTPELLIGSYSKFEDPTEGDPDLETYTSGFSWLFKYKRAVHIHNTTYRFYGLDINRNWTPAADLKPDFIEVDNECVDFVSVHGANYITTRFKIIAIIPRKMSNSERFANTSVWDTYDVWWPKSRRVMNGTNMRPWNHVREMISIKKTLSTWKPLRVGVHDGKERIFGEDARSVTEDFSSYMQIFDPCKNTVIVPNNAAIAEMMNRINMLRKYPETAGVATKLALHMAHTTSIWHNGSTVPLADYNNLRGELNQLREKHEMMVKQVIQPADHDKLLGEVRELREKCAKLADGCERKRKHKNTGRIASIERIKKSYSKFRLYELKTPKSLTSVYTDVEFTSVVSGTSSLELVMQHVDRNGFYFTFTLVNKTHAVVRGISRECAIYDCALVENVDEWTNERIKKFRDIEWYITAR